MNDDLIKNDVPANGQIADGDAVRFCLTENADVKILFLGNSITRHGKAEELGWYGDYGMAASCERNDYVHKLVEMIEETGKTVSYCTANLSEFERTRDMSLLDARYKKAKDFNADIAIVRLGENARLTENLETFKKRYTEMIEYFAAKAGSVVLTDLFWEYAPFDGFVEKLCKARGYGFAGIHDLGDCDDMKATGKFTHPGVAAHPGDKGMAEIAARIFAAMSRSFCP